MKILIISALDIKSKSIQVIKNTVMAYALKGHFVYFITFRDDDKNSDYFYEDIIDHVHSNVEIIRLILPFNNIIGFLSGKSRAIFQKFRILFFFIPKVFLSTAKISNKENIDIIYGYEIFGILAMKFIRKFNKKYKESFSVIRFQGTIIFPYINNYLKLLPKLDHLIALKTESDLVIMTNDGTSGDIVLKKLNNKSDNILFLKNGVDKTIYIPNINRSKAKKEIGFSEEEIILLTISRLVGWKRLDRTIKAMPKIINKHNKIKLIIIGDGSERNTLEQLVSKKQLSNNVFFLGAVNHSEIKNYINLADIFISLYDLSNLGNPIFEALVCGKCIVTLDNGTTGSVIKDGMNGILLNEKELHKLSEIIVDLINDPDRRKKLEIGALEYSNNNIWTWDERMKYEVDYVASLVNKSIN